MSAETIESRYRVTGMDCAGCGRKIDTAMRRLAGVEDVSVSVSSGVLKVQHGGAVGDDAVLQQLRNLGYEAAKPKTLSPRLRAKPTFMARQAMTIDPGGRPLRPG